MSVTQLKLNQVDRSVIIHSKDRVDGSTSAQNFQVDLTRPGKEAISSVLISHCSIPHTWKNINSNTNTIVFSAMSTGGAATFTMDVGNYNATQLATQLQTELNTATTARWSDAEAHNTTFTVAYDSNKDTYTIADSASGTFTIDWSTSNMRTILGYSSSATTDESDSVSDLSPLVSGIQTLSLHAGAYGDGVVSDSKNINDVLLEIPIVSKFGEQLIYQPGFENILFKIPNFHSLVSFRLSVDYNNGTGRVDLPSDSDWTLYLIDVEEPKAGREISKEVRFIEPTRF